MGGVFRRDNLFLVSIIAMVAMAMILLQEKHLFSASPKVMRKTQANLRAARNSSDVRPTKTVVNSSLSLLSSAKF